MTKNMDILEMDKENRFNWVLNHPRSTLDDYFKLVYKEELEEMKEFFGNEKHKK